MERYIIGADESSPTQLHTRVVMETMIKAIKPLNEAIAIRCDLIRLFSHDIRKNHHETLDIIFDSVQDLIIDEATTLFNFLSDRETFH